MRKTKPISEMSEAELSEELERLKELQRDQINVGIGNNYVQPHILEDLDRFGRSDVYRVERERSLGFRAVGMLIFVIVAIPLTIIVAIYFGR